MYIRLVLKTGFLKDEVVIAVVPANIPLLISKAMLKKWGAVIDFDKKSIFLKETNEEIPLEESESGHLMINVGKTIEQNADEVVEKVFLISKKKDYRMNKLKKIHQVFGHKCADKIPGKLIKLY